MNCKKCGNSFPYRIVIDGRIRVISNRKYCLDCSPFGSKNTKVLEKSECETGTIKQCTYCNKTYTGRGSMCGICRTNTARIMRKQRAVNYKGSKCIICGYNKCLMALQFHHVNPRDKSFGISSSNWKKWETIKKELDKCVLLCANCHVEVEYGDTELGDVEIKQSLSEDYIKPKEVNCSMCGKACWKYSKSFICAECKRHMPKPECRKVEWPTKEELIKQVWEKSFTKLAKDYGVSDKTISKWCDFYNIPKPPLGYWARKN